MGRYRPASPEPAPAPLRRPVSRTGALVVAVVAVTATRVLAFMPAPSTLDALIDTSARIFRGQCVAVETGTADVAGARLPVTTYTFRVVEHLKGGGTSLVRFRQVGTPGGGPRDLGRLAGLPTYGTAGGDYVLFLLPKSRAGLTSPAGAGEGAFLVSGERVRPAKGGPIAPAIAGAARRAAGGALEAEDGTVSYDALRRAVRDRVQR